MKRTLLCIFMLFLLTTYASVAHAIDVSVSPWAWGDGNHAVPYEGAGTPPENAFPLVCYVVGFPEAIVKAIQNEAIAAQAAATQGKTIPRPLWETFKNGVPVPMYTGYYVIYDDFNIYYVNRTGADQKRALHELSRKKPRINLKVPRWSWHGVLSSLRLLAKESGAKTMAFTLGIPPDPDYVPEIRKQAIVPLSAILDPSATATYHPAKDAYDAVIINRKPGMAFKVIDDNFIIP